MISSSLPAHADTHSCTEAMKSGLGQKHLVSLFDEHLGMMLSQVLRQLGRTEGQGAEDSGGGGPEETVVDDEVVDGEVLGVVESVVAGVVVVVDGVSLPGVVVVVVHVVGGVSLPGVVVVVVPGVS